MKWLALLLLIPSFTLAQGNPDPGSTNLWSADDYDTLFPQSLALRIESISGGTVDYQGEPWAVTNGQFIAVPGTLEQTNGTSPWSIVFAVTNTVEGEWYRLEYQQGLQFTFLNYAQFSGTNGEYFESHSYAGPPDTGFWRIRNLSYIFDTPVVTSGANSCANYQGIASYLKSSPTFGWAPDTNFNVVTVSDGTGRTDTRISYTGRDGDTGCATGSISITNPPSNAYRFTLFFSNNVPSGPYPVRLNGFLP
jgi:hypothetical protein